MYRGESNARYRVMQNKKHINKLTLVTKQTHFESQKRKLNGKLGLMERNTTKALSKEKLSHVKFTDTKLKTKGSDFETIKQSLSIWKAHIKT